MSAPKRYLFEKTHGNCWKPVSHFDAEYLNQQYELNRKVYFTISKPRNPGHHQKLFAMMRFVREHTVAGDLWENDYDMQKEIQMITGPHDERKTIDGDVRKVCKSIAFDSMPQSEFNELYEASFRVIYHKFFHGSEMSLIREELEQHTDEILGQLEGFG